MRHVFYTLIDKHAIMIQKMFVEKFEVPSLYPLPLVQFSVPVLDINLEIKEKVASKSLKGENEKAFIDKKPIYKAKNYELF